MAESGITKLGAAGRQLGCALRFRREGGDSLAVHTLAWAAYCLLRDVLGKSQTREVLRQFEKSEQLGKVPNYLKHADKRPQLFSKHLRSTPTSRGSRDPAVDERGQPETSEMPAFSALPNPFKPASGQRGADLRKAGAHHRPRSG